MPLTLAELHAALAECEASSRRLEPSPDEWRETLEKMSLFSRAFLEGMEHRPAWEGSAPLPLGLREPIPADPIPFEAALEIFSRSVIAGGVNPTSGRFVGYVPGGGLPTAAVGDYLAALTNKYAGMYYASPGAAEVENSCIRWMRELTGMPEAAWGTLQSGGSLATLTAVVAARETRPPEDWAKSVIYLTSESHLAVAKALHIAGLGYVPQRTVAVGKDYRLVVGDLEEQLATDRALGLHPWMIFATAGTTNTGAIDPLGALAALARRERLWLHIDAAYGGFFVLCNQAREQLRAMSEADSIVLDPHKGLFLPYGCGAVLVRDGDLLRKSLLFHSDYLPAREAGEERSPADYSPELTRHFRGLRLWLSIKLHGIERFRAALDEKLFLARLAHLELSGMGGIEAGPSPQLSCAVFRAAGPDARTQALHDKILARGRVFLSPTRLDGRLYLRLCVLCFRTHRAEVEAALEEVRLGLKTV